MRRKILGNGETGRGRRAVLFALCAFFASALFGAEILKNAPIVYGEEPLLRAGSASGERTVLTLCAVEVPFRWIAPGSFTMGSPLEEPLRDEAEVAHEVTITRGFWLSETEITQRFYEAVTEKNPSEFRGAALPVDTVSWDDAVKFCETLRAKAGGNVTLRFRLPTEAEWEYAARAGNAASGLDTLECHAWSGFETASGTTHEVGTKEPNAWGLHDMQGNLWEWCADGWSDFTSEKQTDPFAANESNPVRIDRGGCWDSPPQHCRFAWRGVYERDRASRFVGFRIAFFPND